MRSGILFCLVVLLCVSPALGSPDAVSYADDMTLVHDQDHMGGCQGYSALHVLEALKEKELPYSPDPSYGFLMYVFQAARNASHPDPRVAYNPNEGWQSILTTYGLPPETSYPTDFDTIGLGADTLEHPPSDEAFEQARGSRAVADSSTTVVNRPTVLQAEELIDGGPVVCEGIYWVPPPPPPPVYPGESHTVALVGYDRTLQEFTMVDSANWEGIPHADVKRLPYARFEAYRQNITLSAVRNTASSYQPPYTARIRVSHADRRSFLTVKIGAEGHDPVTVWDQNNLVNYTDWGQDLNIDVPLPAYAAEHWPPSDQNLWYVEVTNHDADHSAELREVTLVRRLANPDPLPDQIDVYRQPGVPMAIGPGTARIQFPLSLTITSPNGGEHWVGGERRTVTFGQAGLSGTNVRIDLLRGTTPVAAIASSWPAQAGSIDWYVPTSLPAASDYYVQVQSLADTRISDRSDAPLTVTPPAAAFTADPVSGLSPLTVRFTDTSSGAPTSWQWSFGDGQTSGTASPSHAYANPGTYSVTLTVTYPGGATMSVTKTDLVTVYGSLHPDFNVNARIGYEPFTVRFTDTTTGNPSSWHWDFGDGGSSTLRNPTHTYEGALSGDALYTVTLTVSNAYDTKTATKTDFIRVLPRSGGLARVEAEDYETGGEGVAYHDTTAGNSGGVYRSDGVDIIASGSGYAVTGIAETEWTQYWVWSPADQEWTFPITLRLACRADGRTIGITAAGVTGSTVVAVPNTGSTSVYTSVNATLRLKPGANDVRFAYHGDLMNFDYFALDPAGVPAPDLAFLSLQSPLTGTIWNRTLRLSNQVANVGTAPAGPFTIGFYLSSDDTITTADTLIGTRSIAGLDAGSVTPSEVTTMTIPPSAPAGRHFIGMIVDPANVVAEMNELNNYGPPSPRTVDIAASADLASWTYVPPQSPITRSFTIMNIVKNLGTAAAGPFYVGFYLSGDTAITTADTKIGEWYCAGLGAGAQSSLQQTPITIPASVPAGTYYIGSILDSTGAVTEGNENNNLASNHAPLVLPASVGMVPGGTGPPQDPDADAKYEDVNGNGRKDFADVVLYFNQMAWIAGNEPVSLFDYNGNGRIDFADVVWLFNSL